MYQDDNIIDRIFRRRLMLKGHNGTYSKITIFSELDARNIAESNHSDKKSNHKCQHL